MEHDAGNIQQRVHVSPLHSNVQDVVYYYLYNDHDIMNDTKSDA